MTEWIVTYQYRGSRYFDSPLRWREERMAFKTYKEAKAWADGPHDLPEYKTLGIHKESIVVNNQPGTMNYYSAERYWKSDGNDYYGRKY